MSDETLCPTCHEPWEGGTYCSNAFHLPPVPTEVEAVTGDADRFERLQSGAPIADFAEQGTCGGTLARMYERERRVRDAGRCGGDADVGDAAPVPTEGEASDESVQRAADLLEGLIREGEAAEIDVDRFVEHLQCGLPIEDGHLSWLAGQIAYRDTLVRSHERSLHEQRVRELTKERDAAIASRDMWQAQSERRLEGLQINGRRAEEAQAKVRELEAELERQFAARPGHSGSCPTCGAVGTGEDDVEPHSLEELERRLKVDDE